MQTVKLNLSAELAKTINEMASQRFLSLEHFIVQTIDTQAVAFRRERHRAKAQPLILPESQAAADQDLETTRHQKVSAPIIQKILHSFPALNPGQLSKRFNIAPTTVRRILATHAASKSNNPTVGMQSQPPRVRPFSLKVQL